MHRKSFRRIHAEMLIMTPQRMNLEKRKRGGGREERDDILPFLFIFLIYLNFSQ